MCCLGSLLSRLTFALFVIILQQQQPLVCTAAALSRDDATELRGRDPGACAYVSHPHHDDDTGVLIHHDGTRVIILFLCVHVGYIT